MKDVIFITPADGVPGFSLAGFIQVAQDEKKLADLLNRITDNDDYGMIVFDERLYNSDTETLINQLEKKWNGVFILLPSPEFADTAKEDYAARMLRRAIGYQVRIER